MAIVSWSHFYPEVAVAVPGCPNPMIDNALRNASRELLSHSKVYRADLTTITTVADQPTYPLAYDSDTEVSVVLELRSTARAITEKTVEELNQFFGLWQDDTGEPVHFFLSEPNTLRPYPIPDDAYDLYPTVALIPSLTATGIEQEYADQYREEIAAGALARLLNVPNTPWRDKEAAKEKSDAFIKAKGEAAIDALRNYTVSSIRVKPRAFK